MRAVVGIMMIGWILLSAHGEGRGEANPRVALETDQGKIVVELLPDRAPISVENFMRYIESGYYDGTIFHRVIPNFMIQGGGFTADMTPKSTRTPIQNEADNGLSNRRGTVAMARSRDPHSATAQFFINTADNEHLNHKGKTPQEWGYAVFGQVIEGMGVIDRISALETQTLGAHRNVPVQPVRIIRAYPLAGADD
jgi:peptidyl-prolyl cis-trans isomerase B (cyclophilin B)